MFTFFFCNPPLISRLVHKSYPCTSLYFSHLALHGLQREEKEENHLEFLFLTFLIGSQPPSHNHQTSCCLTNLSISGPILFGWSKDTRKKMELEAEARLPTDYRVIVRSFRVTRSAGVQRALHTSIDRIVNPLAPHSRNHG